jgi:hypothetical protein
MGMGVLNMGKSRGTACAIGMIPEGVIFPHGVCWTSVSGRWEKAALFFVGHFFVRKRLNILE